MAVTLHVDNVLGSDSNSGADWAHALQTIGHANSHMTAASVAYIKHNPGVPYEFVSGTGKEGTTPISITQNALTFMGCDGTSYYNPAQVIVDVGDLEANKGPFRIDSTTANAGFFYNIKVRDAGATRDRMGWDYGDYYDGGGTRRYDYVWIFHNCAASGLNAGIFQKWSSAETYGPSNIFDRFNADDCNCGLLVSDYHLSMKGHTVVRNSVFRNCGHLNTTPTPDFWPAGESSVAYFVWLDNCLFIDNVGPGAFVDFYGVHDIRRCTFLNNGSGVFYWPGGMQFTTVEDCIFQGNTKAFEVKDAGTPVFGPAGLGKTRVTNCAFWDNDAICLNPESIDWTYNWRTIDPKVQSDGTLASDSPFRHLGYSHPGYPDVAVPMGCRMVVATPSAPGLTATNVGDGSSIQAAVTGFGTITVVYRQTGSTDWTTGGTSVGDGTVTISGLVFGTNYEVSAYRTIGGIVGLNAASQYVTVAGMIGENDTLEEAIQAWLETEHAGGTLPVFYHKQIPASVPPNYGVWDTDAVRPDDDETEVAEIVPIRFTVVTDQESPALVKTWIRRLQENLLRTSLVVDGWSVVYVDKGESKIERVEGSAFYKGTCAFEIMIQEN